MSDGENPDAATYTRGIGSTFGTASMMSGLNGCPMVAPALGKVEPLGGWGVVVNGVEHPIDKTVVVDPGDVVALYKPGRPATGKLPPPRPRYWCYECGQPDTEVDLGRGTDGELRCYACHSGNEPVEVFVPARSSAQAGALTDAGAIEREHVEEHPPHGFWINDPDGRFVAHIQAKPDLSPEGQEALTDILQAAYRFLGERKDRGPGGKKQ